MLDKLARSGGYWVVLLALGLAMEAIALFFQYGLDYGPCVLCIHIRIWVAALILLSLVALLVRKRWSGRLFSHLAGFGIAIGFMERAWQTLAVERGWVEGACNLDSGLPDWFALDRWFPTLFEVWEACGYTPELLFGITMAEGLIVIGVGLLLGSLTMLISTLLNRTPRKIFHS